MSINFSVDYKVTDFNRKRFYVFDGDFYDFAVIFYIFAIIPFNFDTMDTGNSQMYYLSQIPGDSCTDMLCTTSGRQKCGPNAQYPVSTHPSGYSFQKTGRLLNEYQMIYIVDGQGYFRSDLHPLIHVDTGSIILIRPGEKHFYYPDEQTGWDEMWVGFKGGEQLERTVSSYFKNG